MSRSQAAWLLWVAAMLLIPLPYFILADGAVPAIRFAMLAAVAAAYAGFVDGSGVAWPLTVILLLHVVVSALVLALLAALAAYVMPVRSRGWLVAALIVAGFAVALGFDVYRTPFDDVRPRAGWLGLFQ